MALPPAGKLARKRRVHLRIRKKTGLFFLLRPYLRRQGLWAGLLLFVPLLLWSQGLVWAVDASGLTTGPAGAGRFRAAGNPFP